MTRRLAATGYANSTVVRGMGTHYSCRTIEEIDAHLRVLLAWLARGSTAPIEFRSKLRQRYWYDIDKLLDARVMLRALDMAPWAR